MQRLQAQIRDARKVIEELETRSVLQIAETKQQMHTTMEAKDTELQQIRATVTSLKQENDDLTARLKVMEKKCEFWVVNRGGPWRYNINLLWWRRKP